MDEVTNFEEEKAVAAGMFGAMSTASIVYGIILIIISMFLFTSPDKSYMLVTTLLGIYLVVKGLIDFIAVFNSNNSDKGMTLFSSVVSFLAGFIVLSATVFATTFLVTFVIYVIGFSFVLSGLMGFKNSIPMALVNIAIGVLMFFFTEGVATGFVWMMAFLILLGGVFSIVFGAAAKNVVREIKA
ncbi:MAG: DUF308 domain-containing protein [Candidatus Moraniibacteriota bacterium]|jgi:uncharacterized membrane protein HdeD (DUF308 family)